MIQKLKKYLRKSAFHTNILSIFQHSFLMRKAIFQGIENNSSFLSWDILDFWCWEKPYKELFEFMSYTGVDFKNSWHDYTQNQVDVFWNGKTLPFEDISFDSILATEEFEHIFNIEEVLGELHRVLREWGDIVITIPFVIHEHEIPYDFARYTHYGIADILKKNGFEIIRNQQYGSYAETIIQLNIWFLGKTTETRFKYLTLFLRVFFVAPVLVILNILSLISPKMQSGMYLSNTIVWKKRMK